MARTTAQHVGVYARISFDPLGVSAGVDRQLADCRRIAEQRWPGVPVVEFIDRDTSAWSGKRREGFEAMLAALDGGQLSAVVVYDVDRLARQPRDLERLIDLMDSRKMRSFATAQGSLDLGTSDGRAMARVLVAMATKASDDTSRRVKRAMQDRRERGLRPAGRLQYGIESWEGAEIVPNPRQRALIETVARRLLEGGSLNALRHWLVEQDPAAPKTHQGVRDLLLNSRVMDPVLRADVTAFLQAPDRRVVKSTRRAHFLSGLIACGVCGERLRTSSDKRYPTWTCKRNSCVAISKVRTDEIVLDLAFKVSAIRRPTPITTPVVTGPDQEQLNELAEMLKRKEITLAEWKILRSEVPTTVDVPAPPLLQAVDDLANVWEGMTVDEQHRALSAIWRAILVLPLQPGAKRGRGVFDPNRIVYVPHHGPTGNVEITAGERLTAAEVMTRYAPMAPATLTASAIEITADGMIDPLRRGDQLVPGTKPRKRRKAVPAPS